MKGFVLQIGDHSPEANQLSNYCLLNDVPLKRIRFGDELPEGFIPSGGIQFCEDLFGFNPKPDYYPDFLNEYLRRSVWEDDKWILGEKLFIKPSDKYKRFTGFVTKGTNSKKKKPPFWYSDVINISKEARYYVVNGKVLGGYLYDYMDGDAHDISSVKFPEYYCGAVDFGLMENELVLVEAQHPYACGWYGPKEDFETVYLPWLVNGWNYMMSIK